MTGIQTPRLSLRPYTPDDLDLILECGARGLLDSARS